MREKEDCRPLYNAGSEWACQRVAGTVEVLKIVTRSCTNTLSNMCLIPLQSHRSPRWRSAACRTACHSSRMVECQSDWSCGEEKVRGWVRRNEATRRWEAQFPYYYGKTWFCLHVLCACISVCTRVTHQVWALGRLFVLASIWWMVKSLGPAAPAVKTKTGFNRWSLASNSIVKLLTNNSANYTNTHTHTLWHTVGYSKYPVMPWSPAVGLWTTR